MTKDEIKDLRLKLLLTQEQFAVALGARTSTVSSWEQGRGKPNRYFSEKLEELKNKFE